MRGHRESVVLATKYSNTAPGNDPNAASNHRKNMMQAVEASLKRLQTDYIDLYWVHIWDGVTPVEEVMRGLDDLVRQGKVLYVGISDAPAWWVAQANTLAELRGWTQFIGLRLEYSLIERTSCASTTLALIMSDTCFAQHAQILFLTRHGSRCDRRSTDKTRGACRKAPEAPLQTHSFGHNSISAISFPD